MTSPTVKRRRLSHILRELRQAAELTATEAAKRLEWDPAKVARMERNQWKLPNVHDIRLLLDLYGVTDERRREALINLARESRQRGWWADYDDVFRSSLPDFEAGASVIRSYEGLIIPGLLQTAAYAAAVWRAGQVLDEDVDHVIERHVKARLARQRILDRTSPPELLVVVDEAALVRTVGGPKVMQEQLQHLIKMAARATVTMQVIPNSVGAHAAMIGGFMILDFESPEDDPSLVYIETATENLWLETPDKHRHYALIYSRVQALALPPDESVSRMTTHMDEYGK